MVIINFIVEYLQKSWKCFMFRKGHLNHNTQLIRFRNSYLVYLFILK